MYRWVDHTAELELQLEARTEEEVFREGLAALGELLGERTDADARDPARHEVHASAPDPATLLAEWLSELAYLAETQGFVPERVDSLSIDSSSLRTPRDLLANRAFDLEASVSGRRADPPHLIKAVTYHRLEMRESGDGWRARVVLDV
ncbi:MAG: archease [Solirubrobacterales bacterium]